MERICSTPGGCSIRWPDRRARAVAQATFDPPKLAPTTRGLLMTSPRFTHRLAEAHRGANASTSSGGPDKCQSNGRRRDPADLPCAVARECDHVLRLYGAVRLRDVRARDDRGVALPDYAAGRHGHAAPDGAAALPIWRLDAVGGD